MAGANRVSSAGSRLLLAALFAILAGCSSERTEHSLAVTATPNPVTGVAAEIGREWTYTITIENSGETAVTMEGYFHAISETDTGYSQALRFETASGVVGRKIEAGASFSYEANRQSDLFSTGIEQRIYQGLGDDGNKYTGKTIIELR